MVQNQGTGRCQSLIYHPLLGRTVVKPLLSAAGYSGIGALFVIGTFLLNKQSKNPIVDLAVGPVACIIFGILLNIFLLIGFITIPTLK